MKQEINLTLTPEIIGAITDHKLSKEQAMKFKNDPNSFLAEMNLKPNADMQVQAIENSANEIHLALPFYEGVEESSAIKLSDENVEGVSGGEIIVNAILAVSVLAVMGGVVYAVTQDSAIKGRNEAFEEITGQEFPEKGK